MPRYRVPLVRETTEYEWARIVVEAASQKEAIEKAIERAEISETDFNGVLIEWNDHGAGYGGFEISKTPNVEVELIEDEEV